MTAAFGTLGRLYGRDARAAITTLTLFGGFASTACWPLSAFLVSTIGWRDACLAYAAIQLCFPSALSRRHSPCCAGGNLCSRPTTQVDRRALHVQSRPGAAGDTGAHANPRSDNSIPFVGSPPDDFAGGRHGAGGGGWSRRSRWPGAGGGPHDRDGDRPLSSSNLDEGSPRSVSSRSVSRRFGQGYRSSRSRWHSMARASASKSSREERCRSRCSGLRAMQRSWAGSPCRACSRRPPPPGSKHSPSSGSASTETLAVAAAVALLNVALDGGSGLGCASPGRP